MTTLVLPKGTVQILRELTGEARPETALLLVLRDVLAYRLEQIERDLNAFETKYGMTFAEYRQRWETEDRDEDYRWEALVTRKHRLEETYGWLT